MNRINKRKQYERGYYQTHPCTDSFTCKHCGRPVVSAGAVPCRPTGWRRTTTP